MTRPRVMPKTDAYAEFLSRKVLKATASGFDAYPMPDFLFDYQKFAIEFCIKQGKSALFLDTGLGKTLCELEFCSQVMQHVPNAHCLILTPLAVAWQTQKEAEKYGYTSRIVRSKHAVRSGINICNYDMIDALDADVFVCVVLDESSILKNFAGKTTLLLIETFAQTPYRLCATATPAPNDYMEMGTHSDFLGVLSQHEMLTRWFINDTSTASKEWRLKGHAREAFWDWVSSWAIMAESPEDLGFDGSRFKLPKLEIVHHTIKTPPMPETNRGGFFSFADVSATKIHEVKRHTTQYRAEAVKQIVNKEPNEFWLIWCDTDYEADAIKEQIDVVDIRGSMTREQKEMRIEAFVLGKQKRLLTKPSIAGVGLNLQQCSRMIFAGRTFSYEQWYQAVRRCWRFGQKNTVYTHVLLTEGEEQINRVIERKSTDHKIMKASMNAATRRRVVLDAAPRMSIYNPTHEAEIPAWLK